MVLLWMMIWIITEKQVFLSEQFLKKKEEEQKQIAYSNWEVCRLAFCQIKEILCMSWSLFVDLKKEAFSRYFSPQKRHRIKSKPGIPYGCFAWFNCLSSRLCTYSRTVASVISIISASVCLRSD